MKRISGKHWNIMDMYTISNRRKLRNAFLAGCVVGMTALLSLDGWPDQAQSSKLSLKGPMSDGRTIYDVKGIAGYSPFKDPMTGVLLEVPSNWVPLNPSDMTGKNYTGGKRYKWMGPATSDGSGYVTLGLFVVPAEAIGSELTDLQKFSNMLIDHRLGRVASRVDRSAAELAGGPAVEVSAVYPSLFPAADGKPSSRKETWITVKRQNYFMWIVYSSGEAEYDAYLPAYQRAKETITPS